MSFHTGALRLELAILFVEPQLRNGESSPSWAGDEMPAQDLVHGVHESSLCCLRPFQVSAGERGPPRGGSIQLQLSSRA